MLFFVVVLFYLCFPFEKKNKKALVFSAQNLLAGLQYFHGVVGMVVGSSCFKKSSSSLKPQVGIFCNTFHLR